MHHFRKTKKAYKKANAGDKDLKTGCSFCDTILDDSAELVDENDTMIVIKNRVAYDMFDNLRTTGEHNMVIPKRHLLKLEEFSDQERADCFDLISKYESSGFSIYARSTKNINRSQPHQHTHLIKTTNRSARIVIYLKKPYLLKVV